MSEYLLLFSKLMLKIKNMYISQQVLFVEEIYISYSFCFYGLSMNLEFCSKCLPAKRQH